MQRLFSLKRKEARLLQKSRASFFSRLPGFPHYVVSNLFQVAELVAVCRCGHILVFAEHIAKVFRLVKAGAQGDF